MSCVVVLMHRTVGPCLVRWCQPDARGDLRRNTKADALNVTAPETELPKLFLVATWEVLKGCLGSA